MAGGGDFGDEETEVDKTVGVDLPDVTGMKLEDALALLESHGFKVNVKYGAKVENEAGDREVYVNFNAAGGEGTVDMVTVVLEGEEVTGVATMPENSFTRDGYVFAGWATTPEMQEGETLLQPGDTMEVTFDEDSFDNSYIMYARWSDSLIYDGNGTDVQGTMDPTLGMGTGKAVVAANGFTRPGYVFDGWNTAIDGTGTAYEVGAEYELDADVVDTLYAQWRKCLSYDANGEGATQVMAPTPVADGETDVVVADDGFGRPGYVFLGWNTEADGSGTAYQPGDNYTLTSGVDVLYAQWRAFQGVGKLTFDGNAYQVDENGQPVVDADGNPVPEFTGNTADVTGENGFAVEVPDCSFTRKGYDFSGWNTAADGTAAPTWRARSSCFPPMLMWWIPCTPPGR